MSSPDGLHHRLDGPEGGRPLILGPSLGTSLALWEPVLPELARDFRVLRFDLPGHGRCPADLFGDPPSIATLARLVLGLADAYGWREFHYAGVSIGGAIGLRLALDSPDRIASLALICSAARFGDPAMWRDRIALVREKGTAALAGQQAGRWFSEDFAARPRARALVSDLEDADDAGYAACCVALAGFDVAGELGRVSAPTLVIAGGDDPATPPAKARELADGIPGASLVEIGGASHLAVAERPGPVAAALCLHLGAGARRGLRVRREVLGDEHVGRATAGATEFTADFQDLITRYAWGEIWTRPGLDRRTRSCITLTALVAGGHHDELAMHVRAALRNGLSPDEIKEVLLQTAIYCGVPAANTAFKIAQRVLDDNADPYQ